MASQTRAAVPDRLVEQLEATRAGMRRYRWALGTFWAAFATLALAGALVGADWNWVLGTPARAAGLVGIAVAALTVFEQLVLRPRRLRDREEAAAEVEANFPKLGQRVRTTLEYVDPTPETAPAAAGLIAALKCDTARQTRDLDFQAVVPWGRLRRPVAGLALLTVGAVVCLIEQPELWIAARRLLLLPDQYTRLEVKPGDAVVKVGTAFTLQATIAGRPVSRAKWLRRPAGSRGPWTEVSLAPASLEEGEAPGRPLLGTLSNTLKDCQADLEYRVVAGPVESPTYHVRVIRPLELKASEAKVESPAYTRRPAKTETAGDIQVIEGSKVRFRFTLDRAPTSAELRLTAKDSPRTTVPLAIEGATLTGTLPKVDRPLEYQIGARAGDGMELDAKSCTIRVQPDEKPTLKFVKPPEELAVIPTTEIPLQVSAADDFGVAQVGIVYQVGKGPKETLLLDKYKDQPVSAQVLATLYLEKHQVDFTDGLTYYAYVDDNRPLRPQRTSTELRYVDILPYQQAFQMVEGGGT